MNLNVAFHPEGTKLLAHSSRQSFSRYQPKFLDNGDVATFSGKTFKIFLVESPLKKLKESKMLLENQKGAYTEVIGALLPIKKLADFVTAEQLCPGVNKLISWLEKAAAYIPEKGNGDFIRHLVAYNTFVSNSLSYFDQEEGMKFIPGFTEEQMKNAVISIKSDKVRAELLRYFDPIAELIFKVETMPPGANLYRFNSDSDKLDFLKSLGSEYASLQRDLESAVAEYKTDSTAGVKKIASISQEMTELQAKALKLQLAKEGMEDGLRDEEKDVKKKNTVVFMRSNNGVISAYAETYEDLFQTQLKQISACFEEASILAEKVSEPLKLYLQSLSKAVLSGDYTKTEEMRYRMTSKDSYLDLQFERNETYIDSVLGTKGEYNLRLSIFDESADAAIEKIKSEERFKKLNMEGWLVVIAGGRATRRAVSGNKLPNGEEASVFKDVLLNNVSLLIQPERLKSVPDILVLEDGDMGKISAAKQTQIRFHEAEHMEGTSISPHLKNYSNSVEECQAQTSSLVLAEELLPEHVKGILLGMVAYAPIWMTIGLGGAHQKADVYITGRLIEEGAVEITGDNRLKVDVEKSLPIIEQIAKECRILERPMKDRGAAVMLLGEEIKKATEGKAEMPITDDVILLAAKMRAENMFGLENIRQIAGSLKPVAEKITQPVPFVVFGRQSSILELTAA